MGYVLFVKGDEQRGIGNGTNIASAVTTFIFNIILMRLAGANGVAAITVLLYAHFLFSSAYMALQMVLHRFSAIITARAIMRI